MPVGRAIGMLASIVVSASVLAFIPGLNGIAKGAILALLGLTALRMWRIWRYPAVVELEEGRLRWRILGRWSSTPVTNLSRLELHGRQLALRFVDENGVSGGYQRLPGSSTFAAAGFHTAFPLGDVSLTQTNRIRSVLGWEPQTADERGQELNQFVRRLQNGTSSLWVTPTLVALNVAAFLAMWWLDSRSGASNIFAFDKGFKPEKLIEWGANYGPLTSEHEWWRLLSSVFLHGNLIHIGFNMWVLLSIGRLVERLLGNVAYLTTYLFAGICGSIASVWWNPPVAGVGASGAIFGLFGALLGLVIRQRKTFPPEIVRVIRSQSLTFLVANLALGTQIPGIDMAAHVGGAIGGLLCGFLASPIVQADGRRRGPWSVIGLIAVCLALTAVAVATLPPPRFDIRMTLVRIIELEEQIEDSFARAEKRFRKKPDGAELQRAVDEALKPWSELRKEVADAPRASRSDREPQEMLERFLELQQEGWQHLMKAVANDDLAEQGQGIQSSREARREMRGLIEKHGERLGFQLKDPGAE